MKMLRVLLITLFCCITSLRGIILEEMSREGTLTSTLAHKKVGYYIGSFDPLHLGHEGVVQEVLKQGLCDYVLIYPAWGGDAYKNRTDVTLRLDMLFATFKDHPKVIVTRLNPQDLQGVLMQDNESHLIAGKPSVKSSIEDVKYIGIIGSDTALGMMEDQKKRSIFMRGIKISDKYKEHTIGGLMAIPVSEFVISVRTGDSLDQLEGKIEDRPILKSIVAPHPEASSTNVRKLLKSGGSIEHLVNAEVAKIIKNNKLYVGM